MFISMRKSSLKCTSIYAFLLLLFDLILYVPVNNFSVMSNRSSWVEPVLRAEDQVSCAKTQPLPRVRPKHASPNLDQFMQQTKKQTKVLGQRVKSSGANNNGRGEKKS